jgi:hypothetical protein
VLSLKVDRGVAVEEIPMTAFCKESTPNNEHLAARQVEPLVRVEEYGSNTALLPTPASPKAPPQTGGEE